MAAAKSERMDNGFAVFNLHVNEAGSRADAEFIAQFGQKAFDKYIKPHHDDGIMSILHGQWRRSPFKLAWITLVTAFVNKRPHRYRPGYVRVKEIREAMREGCNHDRTKYAGECRYCAQRVVLKIKARLR